LYVRMVKFVCLTSIEWIERRMSFWSEVVAL